MQLLVITKYYQHLSHSYMFRHYRVILRELVINTLPSTQIFQMQLLVITKYYQHLHLKYLCNLARY